MSQDLRLVMFDELLANRPVEAMDFMEWCKDITFVVSTLPTVRMQLASLALVAYEVTVNGARVEEQFANLYKMVLLHKECAQREKELSS